MRICFDVAKKTVCGMKTINLGAVTEREEENMLAQARTFTASVAGSTCATSDPWDVSVKSASQVAGCCVFKCV